MARETKKPVKPDNAALFAEIDKAEMPAAYVPREHQKYVDARIAGMPPQSRPRVGQLWNEFRQANPDRSRDGAMFIRILEHIATNEATPNRRFIEKWQFHNFGSAPDQLKGLSRRLHTSGKYSADVFAENDGRFVLPSDTLCEARHLL